MSEKCMSCLNIAPLKRSSYEPHTCNCNVWCKLAIGFLQEISNLEKQTSEYEKPSPS